MNFLMSIANRLLEVTGKLNNLGKEVDTILRSWVGPIMIALGGVAAIYVIILGIQYVKSENDSKRVEVKTRIVNSIIGIIVILILGFVCFAVNWAELVQIFGYAVAE